MASWKSKINNSSTVESELWRNAGRSEFQLQKTVLKSDKIWGRYLMFNFVCLQTFWTPFVLRPLSSPCMAISVQFDDMNGPTADLKSELNLQFSTSLLALVSYLSWGQNVVLKSPEFGPSPPPWDKNSRLRPCVSTISVKRCCVVYRVALRWAVTQTWSSGTRTPHVQCRWSHSGLALTSTSMTECRSVALQLTSSTPETSSSTMKESVFQPLSTHSTRNIAVSHITHELPPPDTDYK